MPYLSKNFSNVITDFTKQAWTYKKRTGEEITVNTYLGELKSHTVNFYNNLKSLLNQISSVQITFDDDNCTFNIFGIELLVKCLSSYSSGNFNNNDSRDGVFPSIILPRLSTFENSASSGEYSFPRNNIVQYPGINNSSYSIFLAQYHSMVAYNSPKNIQQQVSYGIKIWYNKNYIMCNYISYSGNEYPLFCLIQGKCINQSNKKPVYVSANPNINIRQNNNTYNNTCFIYNHYIVIPEMNLDKTKYYDYLPNLTNYDNSSSSNGNFLDYKYFPNSNIMRKVSESDSINSDVYLTNATAFGGIVQFDNVYNISRVNNEGSLSPQFNPNSYYEIDSEQYYYPGYTFPYNSDKNNPDKTAVQLLFKI